MNEVNLSLQGKQLILFVVKILQFKLSNQNFVHPELDSFPIFKGFSDEISGDINKCHCKNIS